MHLNPIKANVTEIEMNGGLTVLFSYKTPVACKWTNGKDAPSGIQYYKTEKKWSVTTSRHINQWLGGYNGVEKPQEYFDNLLSEVK